MKNVLLGISIILNLILGGYLIYESQSCCDNEAPKQTEDIDPLETSNIVMLGNSITYQGNWKEVLKRDDVFNGGKPGWTTEQLSWVIKNFITPYKPTLCFFTGGINDYTLGIPTERIYQNMCMVMDSIKNVGTNPVFTTVLYQRYNESTNREIDKLNSMMENFCKDKGYDFADTRPFLCKDGDILDEYVKDDNTHLKSEAYPQWVKALEPIIKKYNL